MDGSGRHGPCNSLRCNYLVFNSGKQPLAKRLGGAIG
jgi:hypothetical protein